MGEAELLDNVSMRILAASSVGPVSASEIAERTGVSSSTLYRRLPYLVQVGALRETSALDGKNNHYYEYEVALSCFTVIFDDGEAVISVEYDDGRTRQWTYGAD